MKVTLTPSATYNEGQHGVNVHTNIDLGDALSMGVSVSDASMGARGGSPSLRDVFLRLSSGGSKDARMASGNGFCIEYDAANESPRVELNSSMMVASKTVRMRYRHGLRKNSAALRCDVDIDDKTRLSVNYRPDANNFDLRNIHNESDVQLRYELDDKTVIEPGASLRNKSFNMKVTRQLTDDNSMSLRFDSHTQDGVLELTQRMSDGDVKVTCSGNVSAGGAKRMPRIQVQKEWSLDL